MISISHRYISQFLLVALFFSVSQAVLLTGAARCAADDAIDMIIELLSDPDDDMRMLAIQQIREQAPGKDATKRFAAALPKLPLEVQIKLIDALGERGDPTARPTILKMLGSKTEALRAVAAQALSNLAGPADIPLLAKVAATGSSLEQQAARLSLRKLPGNAMNLAMTETLKNSAAKPKVELITALLDRQFEEAISVIIKSADDPDQAVRLAVLEALRAMADERHTQVLVKRLKAAQDKSERRKVALALRATCTRGQAKCAESVIAGFDRAEPDVCIFLMRALAEAGGPKSLSAIVARLKDSDQSVRDEAVRVLSSWKDRNAIVHLKQMARDVKNMRNHILAMRGLVRLASPGKNLPADLSTLNQALQLATRKEEKILVLGTLGTIPKLESLSLVIPCLDHAELVEDACFVAVLIAEKMKEAKPDQVRAVMQKVVKKVQNEETRARAQKVLEKH
jgi:HEAT repeat protein